MFGAYTKTQRGFELITFKDAYGHKCSLQQSSAVGPTVEERNNPGTSCVWLGIENADPKIMKTTARKLGLPLPPGEVSGWMDYPIPEDVQLTTRMHLNRKQVQGLIEQLQQWLATGEFQSE